MCQENASIPDWPWSAGVLKTLARAFSLQAPGFQGEEDLTGLASLSCPREGTPARGCRAGGSLRGSTPASLCSAPWLSRLVLWPKDRENIFILVLFARINSQVL